MKIVFTTLKGNNIVFPIIKYNEKIPRGINCAVGYNSEFITVLGISVQGYGLDTQGCSIISLETMIKSKIKPPLQMEREANCQWTDERRTTGEWQGLTPASKVHQCLHCTYNTTDSNKLKRHTLKHTGERPHSCPYCSYGTTRKELLKEHINIHTGEKPFSCPFCSYTASHRNYLKDHVRRHTGEKPYSCPFCRYRTSQKSNLNSHLLIHKS
ncbi:Chorion transcription factor Cf2-like 1 [Homarus americanus]|uniref:Chorion transcription factor Cf2-like 1 n=1 Tax=Homarus americanus TaxID=6706 RepID=A0A8J5MT94_HOMAM|nr:Chorion transcription factor Cf2-like 1 [Homarus americanus]